MPMNTARPIAAARAAIVAQLEVNGMSTGDAEDAADAMMASMGTPVIEAIIEEIQDNAETDTDGERVL